MDREYIRQVESPITPPQNRHAFWEEGSWLQDNVSYVEKGDGGGDRQSGWIGKVGGEGDAKRFGEKRLAKIQTVIARACLSGARPEYFSLLFSVSGPLFISCQPSPLALRLPRSYSSPCCSSSRPPPLPSFFPSLFFSPFFFSFLSRVSASSSCSFFTIALRKRDSRKRERERLLTETRYEIFGDDLYREKKRERGDILGYNLKGRGEGGEGTSSSRRF